MKFLQSIPSEIKILLLLAALGGQTYFLFRAYSEKAALQDVIEVLEEDMEADRETNRVEFERQQETIDILADADLEFREDLEELDRTKADINKKTDEDKANIRAIRDADSLRAVVARRYTR